MNNYKWRRIAYYFAMGFLAGILFYKMVFAYGVQDLQVHQEDRVVDYVEDPPVFIQKNASALAKLKKCESGNSHYDRKGNVIVSRTGDVGIYQVNLKTWQKTAENMGLDIYNEEDNIEMAYHILTVQGLRAWVCYKGK